MKYLDAALLSALDANDTDEQRRLDDDIGSAPILDADDMAVFIQRLRSWSRDLDADNPASQVIQDGLDRIAEMVGCDPTKHVGDYYGAPVAAFQH